MKHCKSFLSPWVLVAACAVSLVAASGPAPPGAAGPAPAAAANKFVGAAKCKNCHKSEAGGNQFAHWEASLHAKAFETLGQPAAKELGATAGVDDPQKSDKCLKCHVTAFGVAADGIASGFKPELGVQCESCHGPGEQHMKARFAAAAKAKEGEAVVVPEGEIVSAPTSATCTGCHNAESPSYKPFCFVRNEPKIRHLDPRKPVSEERKAELAATCKCPVDHVCTHGAPDSPCDKP